MKKFPGYLLLLAVLIWGCSPKTQPGSLTYAKLPYAGELPILAWHSIPASETSLIRFGEMAETGITHSFSGYPDADALQKALDIAQQTGVKLIISCPELAKEPEATVRRFMKHPALAGYYLRDEPSADDFATLGAWARRIQSVDSEHFCYLNLFPTYASLEQLKSKSYREHVQQYCKDVPTQVLSYDHYPVIEGKQGLVLREDYYENLEIFSDEARKAGRPFWAFALAVAHKPYPIPDMAQLRLQMFSNLAYGAQGLQYFTYWTPGKNPQWNFNHAPIGLDGKRTDVYDKISLLNREIKAITPVFKGCKVMQVRHLGVEIPKATVALTALPEGVKKLEMQQSAVSAKGAGALVSEIQNGAHRYLVIVNRDFLRPLALLLELDQRAKRVTKEGNLISSDLYSTDLLVEAGDMLIYQLD